MSEELKRLLLSAWTEEGAFKWLFAPHPQLGGISAIDAIFLGRTIEVLAVLKRLDEGVYV